MNRVTPNIFHSLFAKYAQCPDHISKLRILRYITKIPFFRNILTETYAGLMLLDFSDYVQAEILRKKVYELRTCKLIESILKPGDTFVDVGANVGQYSILAARCVKEHGKVIAIEPNPVIFSRLRINIALNKHGNVYTFLCAAGTQIELAFFDDPPNDSLGLSRKTTQGAVGDYCVGCFPISELLTALSLTVAPNVIKIDVEGHEFSVIRGLLDQKILPANIIFEFIPAHFNHYDPTTILDYLKEKGYGLFNIEGGTYSFEDCLPEENLWAKLLH